MSLTIEQVKSRLDDIIRKGRIDLYKPIQIAEVLYRSRIGEDIDINNLDTYRNQSIHWRDEITKRFTGKRSTSSARYQHDLWNDTAMPPNYLAVLDTENKQKKGVVEKYIYRVYFAKQQKIEYIINYIQHNENTPEKFDLRKLLDLFIADKGMRRSIDKSYEIVAYSLFETIVTALEATIKLEIPESKRGLINEFADLAKVLLGLTSNDDNLSIEKPAHIYRVGVTNAADRGLDMWANFGIAVQVKHLTLNEELAVSITDQVESDNIVIVCTDADKKVIETITRQISWGKRVSGIITESDLVSWYDKCLRGKFSNLLANNLIRELVSSFRKEFPQTDSALMNEFFEERGYNSIPEDILWS